MIHRRESGKNSQRYYRYFLIFPYYTSIYRNLRSFRRTDILNSSQSLALSLSPKVGNKEPSPVELLDLFPTLADLAGLPPVPLCPKDSEKVLTENKNYAQFGVQKNKQQRDHVMLCTEGKSLAGNNLWYDFPKECFYSCRKKSNFDLTGKSLPLPSANIRARPSSQGRTATSQGRSTSDTWDIPSGHPGSDTPGKGTYFSGTI